MTGTTGAPTYRRYTALDGLRGLAALVVVFGHGLLVSHAIALDPASPPAHQPRWAWALQFTPLQLLSAGEGAVHVFFVLSGFVLCLPFTGAHGVRWRGYYPRRLVRLYLPVWVAVGFAVLTFAVVDHRARPVVTEWINTHDVPVTVGGVARDLVLLRGTGWYNSPLWSLRWEVLFSLLLPLYVAVGRRLRGRVALAAGVGSLLVIAAGAATGMGALVFMPMFGLGVLMAVNRVELADAAARLRGPAWAGIAVAALLLITAKWVFRGAPGAVVLSAAGAVLLVFLFLGQRHAVAVGNARAVQWLGKRSFSLYLVHEPIVVSTAFALRTDNAWLVMAVAIPLSLLAASVFYALVERPSHRLASAVGRRFGDRPERVAQAARLPASQG